MTCSAQTIIKHATTNRYRHTQPTGVPFDSRAGGRAGEWARTQAPRRVLSASIVTVQSSKFRVERAANQQHIYLCTTKFQTCSTSRRVAGSSCSCKKLSSSKNRSLWHFISRIYRLHAAFNGSRRLNQLCTINARTATAHCVMMEYRLYFKHSNLCVKYFKKVIHICMSLPPTT